jgi:phosphoribosylglycinamide formyltransferase-1
MKKVLLFASGGGSNIKAILRYFKDRPDISFPLIITNNRQAGVIGIARQHHIDVMLINKDLFNEEIFIDTLEYFKPDLLVLAGFLWKIPDYIVKAFPNRIINIHPALLPKYGGKGMYGHHVHEAVVAQGEKVSGITIHFVNEHYDEGTTLLQKEVALLPADTPEMVAAKVLSLEHTWYAQVIDSLLSRS